MSAEATIQSAQTHDIALIRQLMQAYLQDLSEFSGAVPNERGVFEPGKYFNLYWTEATRHPFKILVGEEPAGFMLVRELAQRVYSMDEFFVTRNYRGTGVGRFTARAVFNQFPGTWHVAEMESNTPAQHFWRKVIGEYTSGNFREDWSDESPYGPKQIFTSG